MLIPVELLNMSIAVSSIRCRIKKGWEGAGKKGQYLGYIVKDQRWAIIIFDDDKDPTFFKAAGLEIESLSWKDIT